VVSRNRTIGEYMKDQTKQLYPGGLHKDNSLNGRNVLDGSMKEINTLKQRFLICGPRTTGGS
jgi:hypothetical protein